MANYTNYMYMIQQAETYQRILESARDLIYAGNHGDVGIAAVCEKARVNQTSFYTYFKGKRDLTLCVIDCYFADMKASVLDKAFDPGFPPLARLTRFVDMIVAHQISIYERTGHVLGCPFGNLAIELSTLDEIVRKKLDEVFMVFKGLVASTMQEAIDIGELEPTDVDMKAEAFLAYFEGCMLLAKTQNDPTILQRLLPAALDM